jgi:hypothetical protein
VFDGVSRVCGHNSGTARARNCVRRNSGTAFGAGRACGTMRTKGAMGPRISSTSPRACRILAGATGVTVIQFAWHWALRDQSRNRAVTHDWRISRRSASLTRAWLRSYYGEGRLRSAQSRPRDSGRCRRCVAPLALPQSCPIRLGSLPPRQLAARGRLIGSVLLCWRIARGIDTLPVNAKSPTPRHVIVGLLIPTRPSSQMRVVVFRPFTKCQTTAITAMIKRM